METALTFQTTTFDVVDRNGQPWMRSPQIAEALGYTQANRVSDLYLRHSDEFTESMATVIKLPTDSGEQLVRIFSLRGCHLLAMLARTTKAKAFRKWVLDILDNLDSERQSPTQPALPPVDAPITPDQQCTLRALVKAKVEAIPEGDRPRGLYPMIWSRFNNHFRIARYCQLPQTRLSEAVEYLTKMEFQAALPAKPEGLPVPVEPAMQLRTIAAARQKCRFEFIPKGYAATDLKAAQRSKLCFDLYQAQDNLWAMLYNVCSAIQHIREER